MLWCTIWIGLLGACASIALENSEQFVNWPRLVAYPYRAVSKKTIDAKTGRPVKTMTVIDLAQTGSSDADRKTV